MPSSYTHITSRCYINVPFRRLQRDAARIMELRIQPEIGLEGDILYTTPAAEFEKMASSLTDASLGCTLHAPFVDLSPGALDPHIRRVSLDKLKMAFSLIPLFKPASIVCHLSYDEFKHSYDAEGWYTRALNFWQELLTMAAEHRTPIMLENTFELGPAMHVRILEALSSPYARFCLDIGHLMPFSHASWQEWLPVLSPWLGQLHLHDNHGSRDDHLAIGAGTIDFAGFFAAIKAGGLTPIITLEQHEEKDIWPSLITLDQLDIFSHH